MTVQSRNSVLLDGQATSLLMINIYGPPRGAYANKAEPAITVYESEVRMKSLSRYSKGVVLIVAAAIISAHAAMLGNVTSVVKNGSTEVTLMCGSSGVRIKVWDDDLVRIWMDPAGSFTYYNSYNDYMTIPGNFTVPSSCSIADNAADVTITTAKVKMVISKSPFNMTLYKTDGTTIITRNPVGSSFSTDNKAYFSRDANGTIEHFFGLGGNDNQTCDKRGRSRNCYDATMWGAPSPFFMSTAGYGFFLQNDNGSSCTFDFTTSPYTITAARGPMDLFFFFGPDMKAMLAQYTRLTGKPALFPKKTFGLTYHVSVGSNNSSGEVPRFRSEKYPIDNCITFINYTYKDNDVLVRDTCAALHAMNINVVGYVDMSSGLGFDPSYPFDSWSTSNANLKSRLFANGVNTNFADELEQMGEAFQFKYMEASAKAFSEYSPLLRTLVLNRAGYSACQRFGYWWMGDTPQHTQSAKGVIICQLNCGLGGYPHTTHDMAGYLAGSPGTSNALIRGCQMNFIQPISQLNSYRGNQEPWYWSTEAQTIFKKFDLLHYKLLPYWYSIAWQAHNTGLPGWRHLVLDYQNDTKVYAVDDQMMVGDNFLFAPITDEGTSRSIYFPQGTWYNYFTGEQIDGPKTLAYTVPYDQTPLFVKAGGIIPSGPDLQYVDEKALNPLTLEVYPPTNGVSSYTLYEDDGKSLAYYSDSAFSTTTFTCTNTGNTLQFNCAETANKNATAYSPPFPRTVIMVFKNIEIKPQQVFGNNSAILPAISDAAFNAAATGWVYNATTKSVSVKYISNGSAMVITFPTNGTSIMNQIARNSSNGSSFRTMNIKDKIVLEYSVEKAGPVEIAVFDGKGRTISSFAQKMQSFGNHSLIINRKHYSGNGMLFVKYTINGRTSIDRLVNVR